MTRVHVEEPSTVQGSEWSRTYPPEMIAEAASRLGWLGLIYGGTGLIGHFGRRALLAYSNSAPMDPRIEDVFGVFAVAMGFGVYFLTRSRRWSTSALMNLAMTFFVAGAFGLAIREFWDGLPPGLDTAFPLIPVECVWIIGFPLVVPLTPSKVLISSLLSATAGPVALVISSLATGVPIDRPVTAVAFFATTTYLCAVVAYVVAGIVHRFNMRLRHAREIGSYELMERLGQGGMGEVWRAKHRLLARPAAIKLIRSDVLGASQQTREALLSRFEREAKETSTLGSTHTIDVYDFGITEEGDFYYVMELLNGVSFDTFVREYGPMEPARAVHLLRQVCHSLGEAHARGLIHRDIKPANLFMCRLGPDDDFVKVLDFGLVKHVEADSGRSMLTLEGVTAGTPGFMAPEIALGKPGIDGRADLYSLGCVAYFLLTGQQVFEGDTPVAMVLAHVQTAPPPPSARTEIQIPPALDRVILDCLEKEPSARPASAAVLAQRLAEAVDQQAWTAEDARTWWDLRRVVVDPAERAATGSKAESEPAPAVGRCWPKFTTPMGDRRGAVRRGAS